MAKGKKSDKIDRKVARRTLHYYWLELKKYKKLTIAANIITPVTILVRNILAPLVFANMIGDLASDLPKDEIIPTLLPQGLLLVGLYLVSGLVLERLRLYFTWKIDTAVDYDFNVRCFEAISNQSMQFHSDRFSGALVSASNKFGRSFERINDTWFWQILPMACSILFILIVLFPRVPLFALGVLILVCLYVLVAALTFRKISKLNEVEATAYNKVTGQLSDSVTNILSVKSYAREKYERKRYAKYNQVWVDKIMAIMRATLFRGVMFGIINSVLILLLILFTIYGSVYLSISIATLVLMLNYSLQLVGNLWELSSIFRNINAALGDAHDMTEILDTEDTVVDMPNAKKLKVAQGAVNFTTITFQHQDAKQPIFQDFNLDIKPGERVGLVGISGSGKTTLTKLLLRFADVSAGEITIDGQNIKNVTQTSLRENIAYVPQETALFHRSISENIAYARPDASQKEIERAARLANAHEFIKDLPDGYDTLVGERGIKLSGGQRQRVAIARAILKDAPILVLDEATSALDSESEALIQDALIKLMKGRTSIVVAHRLSTIADMDRIVVLENGKIVEQGSHLELVKKNGAYSKLWNRQSGAFIDEGK